MDEQNKGQNLGRRDFVAFSVAAGLTAAGSGEAAETDVVETDVDVKTPDGVCDAAFIHPKSGAHAGILLWPDAFGLRPVTREMGRRLAAAGYSVLGSEPVLPGFESPFYGRFGLQLRKPRMTWPSCVP